MSTSKKINVTLAHIKEAQNLLKKYLPPTPLLLNPWLSGVFGCEIYLKLENMQPIGSFKIRGATFRISQLTTQEKRKGIITASAGNHAQGVAWGAKKFGVKALIVMPKSAPLVKIQNTKALGATVILEGDTSDQTLATARKISRKTGKILVHGFEDPEIIAGNGTVGLEILEQLPDVDFIVGSIGGGGLMAGTAIALKELKPKTQVIGCQAQGAPSMIESFKKGKAVGLERVNTFADGIAIIHASQGVYELLKPRIDQLLQADDEAIAGAVLTLAEKAKIVAEGAGALPLAVLDQMKSKIRGKKVVLIVSGGNIDVNLLSRIIDRGLTRAGRRLRLNVLISDRTGSLAKLTALIAELGGNVLQAIHDRNEPSTHIDQTEVALTLETRGPEHTQKVISALRASVFRLDIAH